MWQIVGRVPTSPGSVAMYDIDLQDAVPASTRVHVPGFGSATWPRGVNAGTIDDLHADGKTVVCYLDSGAYETYRPDAALFPKRAIGNTTGWSGSAGLISDPVTAMRSRRSSGPGSGWRTTWAATAWSRMRTTPGAITPDFTSLSQPNVLGTWLSPDMLTTLDYLSE